MMPLLLPALEDWTKPSMAMEHPHDQNPLGFDQVDEPVRTYDELPEQRELRIPKPVTTVGELRKGFSCIHHQLRKRPRVGIGVLRDELYGSFEVLNRGLRPGYRASHFERRFLTCSWLWTRPAAAASMLRSTFWRT